MKDFRSHRDALFNEMDVIIGDRNNLQDKLNKASQDKDSSRPLLAQIDEWQQQTIEKVKETAEQARQQVKKISNSKRVKITTHFETLSKELVQLKETEDFVEHDLARFRQKISQLNQDLTLLSQPRAIELHMEQSDKIVWSRLIYVEEKITFSEALLESDDVGSCDDEQPPTGQHNDIV
jgi:chromosome segregation ATPase